MNPTDETRLSERVREGSATVSDYIALGELLTALGRGDEAVAIYRRGLPASGQASERAELLSNLGWLHYSRCESESALRCAEDGLTLLEQLPPDLSSWLHKGLHMSLQAHCRWPIDMPAAMGLARRALDHLTRLVDASDPAIAVTAGREVAVLHNLLDEPTNSAAVCERLLQLVVPAESRLHLLAVLAEARRRLNQLPEAEAAVEEAFRWIEANRNALPRLCFELGLAQKAGGKRGAALESFSRALGGLDASPVLANDRHFSAEVHWNLGELYYDLGRYERAIEAFHAVCACAPAYGTYGANAMLWCGHSNLALGDVAEAERCYRSVLDSPDSSSDSKAAAAKALKGL